METNLIVTDEGKGVWSLVLSRESKSNALSGAFVSEISAALKELIGRQARAVIFRSAGKAFCAGFDFSGYKDCSIGDLLHQFASIELMLQDIRRAPFVTIAEIDGPAYGAGADIAIACTWRIGTSLAKFRFPGFQFGLALGTRHLTRLVGMQKARNILLLNQLITAEQAIDFGLLTELVDADNIEQHTSMLVDQIERLDLETTGRVTRVSTDNTDDQDLSDLVRSVVYGNLHQRVEGYLASTKAGKKITT